MSLRLCALTVLSLVTVSCGGGDSPAEPETPVATTLGLSPSTLNFSSLGANQQLTPAVKDQNGVTMPSANVTTETSVNPGDRTSFLST